MNFSKLERLIETMPERGIPACDLIVTHRGETVFRGMAGYSDAAKTKPVSEGDLYWIFSASKPVTCTAAMQLVEQGKLRLDDPVSKYLPAFANLTVASTQGGEPTPAKNVMTVEHLFTMTGGLNYNSNTPHIKAAKSNPNASTLEVVNAMPKDPLDFEPGTFYRYSLCHDVLAAVVEVVSGMRFSDYMQKFIFDPLGMTDTGFRPTEAQKARFGAAYNFINAEARPIEIPNENGYVYTNEYDSGGAGLFSSVNDYAKFVTTLACGGTTKDGYSLLRPETIAQMEVNRLSSEEMKNFVVGRLYGYGWGLCGRVHINPVYSLSRSSIGEFGWDGAAGAFCMVDRATETALYFGMQVHNCAYAYNVLHPVIRNLVFEGLDG